MPAVGQSFHVASVQPCRLTPRSRRMAYRFVYTPQKPPLRRRVAWTIGCLVVALAIASFVIGGIERRFERFHKDVWYYFTP